LTKLLSVIAVKDAEIRFLRRQLARSDVEVSDDFARDLLPETPLPDMPIVVENESLHGIPSMATTLTQPSPQKNTPSMDQLLLPPPELPLPKMVKEFLKLDAMPLPGHFLRVPVVVALDRQRDSQLDVASLYRDYSDRSQSHAEFAGYLRKQGVFGRWQRRYFVMQQRCIFYFDSKADAEHVHAEPLGTIPLSNVFSVTQPATSGDLSKPNLFFKRRFLFKIETAQRPWLLCAESEHEMARWLHVLRQFVVSDVR
jgi:hypothetical protein